MHRTVERKTKEKGSDEGVEKREDYMDRERERERESGAIIWYPWLVSGSASRRQGRLCWIYLWQWVPTCCLPRPLRNAPLQLLSLPFFLLLLPFYLPPRRTRRHFFPSVSQPSLSVCLSLCPSLPVSLFPSIPFRSPNPLAYHKSYAFSIHPAVRVLPSIPSSRYKTRRAKEDRPPSFLPSLHSSSCSLLRSALPPTLNHDAHGETQVFMLLQRISPYCQRERGKERERERERER